MCVCVYVQGTRRSMESSQIFLELVIGGMEQEHTAQFHFLKVEKNATVCYLSPAQNVLKRKMYILHVFYVQM